MASNPVDTTITTWFPGYPSPDTNSPLDADAIGTGLGQQIRNAKSVVRAESINKQWERWLGIIGSFTFVNATTFSMPSDQTAVALVNRRVKATVTAGTIYGSITASTFSAGTTTTVVAWDSGALDSGLSEVQFGSATPINTSIPKNIQSNSGVLGAVQLSDGSTGFTADPTRFIWDTVNHRLGIGTNTPAAPLDIVAGATNFRHTADGAIDFLGLATGSAPAVSAIGRARLYFNSTTGQLLISISAGAYVAVGTGAGGSTVLKGTVVLASGTATVTGLAQADTNYFVTLGINQDEAVHWSAKTTGGFTITSSDLTSTASVDWMVTR